MAGILNRISVTAKNMFDQLGIQSKNNVKNLSSHISPVQFQRLRQDVLSWRDCIREAENAWYPHRVKMQQLYNDTVLNGHVSACIERRKDLTLLRDFEVYNADGKENEDIEKMFEEMWFHYIISYCLDAQFYGYSLVALGDIVNNQFKDITTVRRWNVSPDRLNVSSLTYGVTGYSFVEPPYADWHIYASTPSETGVGSCGFGLLYKVGIYEIFLRNLLGYNGDFVEMFAQPYRIGKTMKTEESERAELAQALQDMGSSGWAIVDPSDTIEFLESALGGTGFQGYDNLEKRCQQYISKVILGHADALDSTSGKLGASQGEDNPIYQAIQDKQTRDGKYIENIVNGQLIPKLRNLGFSIPEGIVFKYSNNAETEEKKDKAVKYAKQLSAVAVDLKNAGLGIDEQYFTEETGIPVYVNIQAMPSVPMNKLREKTKAKLDKLYAVK